MYNFVTVLKVMAVLLITNSHLAGVFPTDLFSHGGMLGNVIFFALSGFCLFDCKKKKFAQWYGKRFLRIYPSVWLITAGYLLLGFYEIEKHNWFYYMIYPLNETYHFITSIMILYIPYYMITRLIKGGWKNGYFLAAVYGLHILVYLFFYDKSRYHIDQVLEPMVRFLFLEAMLWGVYFKENEAHFLSKKLGLRHWAGGIISIFVYLGTKVLCQSVLEFSMFQIVNQFTILAVLWFLMLCFMGIERRLDRMPERIKKVMKWVAKGSLEVYLVQQALIAQFRNLPFPINIILIAAAIAAAASLLHTVVKVPDVLWDRIKRKVVKNS